MVKSLNLILRIFVFEPIVSSVKTIDCTIVRKVGISFKILTKPQRDITGVELIM